MIKGFYFGLFPEDSGGHFMWTTTGTRWLDAHDVRARENGCPFGAEIDGTYAPARGYRADQGQARTVHLSKSGKPWTIIAWHDYTGDHRPGSNSAIVLEGTHDFAAAVGFGRKLFPSVFERLAAAGVEVVPWA